MRQTRRVHPAAAIAAAMDASAGLNGGVAAAGVGPPPSPATNGPIVPGARRCGTGAASPERGLGVSPFRSAPNTLTVDTPGDPARTGTGASNRTPSVDLGRFTGSSELGSDRAVTRLGSVPAALDLPSAVVARAPRRASG